MITFEKIRFKNFLSFGNMWTEIDFTNFHNVLIQGINGSGKSALILDTLAFSLYGKPFRKINKPTLVNNKNKKELVVENYFSTSENNHFKIVRGLNPQIFEIYRNGELLNQNSSSKDYQEILENQILKINYQAFTQLISPGKATYIPFLRLQQQEKRNFIENILNLDIFGVMNDITKSRLNDLKSLQIDSKNEFYILKNTIEVIEKYIEEFQKEILRQQQDHEKLINEQIEYEKEIIQSLVKEKQLKKELIKVIKNDLESLDKKIKSYYKFQLQIQSKLLDLQKRTEFFSKNDTCPVCESNLDSNKKQFKISEYNKKEEELLEGQKSISLKIDNLNDLIKITKDEFNENEKIKNEIQYIDNLIFQHTLHIQQIEHLQSKEILKINNGFIHIDEKQKELNSLLIKREQLESLRIEILKKIDCHNFILTMLKDSGIKRNIIRSYIPQIVQIMNNFLNKLGLFISFDLNENFEEKLYERGIEELSYFAFSEGEKLRIDLAMILTWREICKCKNNMIVNLLIFDEILDNSIDSYGIDKLLPIFEKLKLEKIKIIMVSHSEKWLEIFDEIWSVEKKSGFSKLVKNNT